MRGPPQPGQTKISWKESPTSMPPAELPANSGRTRREWQAGRPSRPVQCDIRASTAEHRYGQTKVSRIRSSTRLRRQLHCSSVFERVTSEGMINQTLSARDKRFGRFQHGMSIIERGVIARAREDEIVRRIDEAKQRDDRGSVGGEWRLHIREPATRFRQSGIFCDTGASSLSGGRYRSGNNVVAIRALSALLVHSRYFARRMALP
jgi:hypothetical protein